MKKFSLVFLSVFIFLQGFLYQPKEVDAIGVIGSNAVKSVVIGSMEKAGVKFASKEAKDKAFDAWNMKAYDKWKADEAAGRNQDLWDAWKSFESNPQKYGKIEPIPDKPGLGKLVVESTVFGMAALIGWEIGSAIYDAGTSDPVLDVSYITDQFELMTEHGFDPEQFGITISQGASLGPGNYIQNYFHVNYLGNQEVLTSATSLTASVTNKELKNGNYWYTVSFLATYNWNTGEYSHTGPGTKIITIPQQDDINPNIYEYKAKPLPEHIPNLNPIPELEPIIGPNADIGIIRDVLPTGLPIEIIVPENPEVDPFWEGDINELYTPTTPTIPGTKPGEEPGTDPKDEEGQDKDKDKDTEENSCERLKKPDFKSLGNAITTSFPFSIPWDIHRLINSAFGGMGSEKPSFTLPDFMGGGEFALPAAFDAFVSPLRTALLVLFDIGLVFLFYRFMVGGGGN